MINNIDTSLRPYMHIMNDKVYNYNLKCIGKGIVRALEYQEKHRMPILVHKKDGFVIKEIMPNLKAIY